MKLLILIPLLAIATGALQAQQVERGSELPGLRYTHDMSGGARITTSGWSIFGTRGRIISAEKSRYVQISLQEIKHPKEQRSQSLYPPQVNFLSPKPYIFGKQNAFYTLQVSFGKRVLIGQKAERSGVEVNWIYQYGPTLGFLKPYYLDVYLTDNTRNPVSVRFSEEIRDRFLSRYHIFGASGFNSGLSEIQVNPGAHFRTGFNFDWNNFEEHITALEVGIGADAFLRRIPIMVDAPARYYTMYLYIGIQFGKKW